MLLPGTPVPLLVIKRPCGHIPNATTFILLQILKPAEKKAKYPYGGPTGVNTGGRPVTPPRKQKKKDANKMG